MVAKLTHVPITRVVVGMIFVLGTACMRVDRTEIQVKDVRAVGVVLNEDQRWLLHPDSPPETVEIYRSVATTETLSRSPSGAITYTTEYWPFGSRVVLPLMDAGGRMGWVGQPRPAGWLTDAIQRGGEIRLHTYVRQTGPFGAPPVSMSLATDSRNIQEVAVTRTPLRALGVGEIILGTVALATGVADGAVALPSRATEARNVALGVGVGAVVLGGLLLGNGLWRLLTPDQRFTYRASD
jgi:hypothetical protein